jgi:hypothetical protein
MEVNPYESPRPGQSMASPSEKASTALTGERLGCLAATLLGALAATIGAFPIAAQVGLIYRFPVPFAGYESGLNAVVRILFAVVFYGVLGGFLVVSVLGALAGLLGQQIAQAKGANRQRSIYLTVGLALAADLPPILLLAVLDKIIGPW